MRPVHQLVHSRTRVQPRYALMPLEGFPPSRLPTWPEAVVTVLASPALGTKFVQYLIELPSGKSGGFPAEATIESFYYVLSGTGSCGKQNLKVGSFGLLPPESAAAFQSNETLKLLILRKRYESATGINLFQSLHGNEADVAKTVWADNPHSLLQTLIPDQFEFDLAMNIFTFDAGFGLPIVETHVMEHGLFFLQGKGLYYLGDEWMEVEANDFIWMGPYCPQSFYATGSVPSRYLYYKNVNREIQL